MKKLPALLNTPARAVIAVGLIILVSEYLIMALFEFVYGNIPKDDYQLMMVFNYLDPIMLIAITSPTLYFLIFRPMRNQQAALSKSNKRFDLAVKGTNDGVWDWDIETNTNYFSPRFLELLDYEPDEVEHELVTFESFLHPEDRAWVFDRVRQHLEDKVPYNVEYRLRTKNGEYRWFQARGEAARDQSGKPVRMAGAITDITDRKKAEEKIKEQLDYLERFKKVAVKREFRIKELTDEIEKLKAGIESLKKRDS